MEALPSLTHPCFVGFDSAETGFAAPHADPSRHANASSIGLKWLLGLGRGGATDYASCLHNANALYPFAFGG